MFPQKLEQIKIWIRAQVSPKRWEHIRGVAATSRKLAAKYGLPEDKAEWAGWLHDCAKELSRGEMLEWIKNSPFKLDEVEKKIPALWHPHAGAAIALKKWGIKDAKILEAIRCHTLGSPRMSLLAQAVFVADFIEPCRRFEGVAQARQSARQSLNKAVLLKCSMTISHLLDQKMKVHGRLLETWNFFLDTQNEN